MSFLSPIEFLFPGFFLIYNPECWTEAVLSTAASSVVTVFNSEVLKVNLN